MERQGLEALVNLCTRRGIIMSSFQAYGEVAGFYDYGPIGTRIKHNIENAWRQFFVTSMNNLEIEATIVAPEKVFEASGHLRNFTDPILNCTKCGHSYRADKLLEEHFSKKGDKKSIDKVKHMDAGELSRLVGENRIVCSACGGALSEIGTFNLMMSTEIGPSGRQKGYLRPETAQGIFLDFKEIFRNYGLKLPIGIGQVGKVFRNEISPRNILVRLREFSQMEMEYFFDPEGEMSISGTNADAFDESINFLSRESQADGKLDAAPTTISVLLERGTIPNRLYASLICMEVRFLSDLGLSRELVRFRELMEDELPHYSKCNIDVEAAVGGGFEEIVGNSYRTDFDLRNHQSSSGKSMEIVNLNKKLIPHVIEISFGTDRLFWSILSNSLFKDADREWGVMILKDIMTPYRYALFPLQKDSKLIEKARQVEHELSKRGIDVFYSESGSIGKRYARSDEIGIPCSLTVDYNTLSDDTVTIRDISDTKQRRIHYSEIK